MHSRVALQMKPDKDECQAAFGRGNARRAAAISKNDSLKKHLKTPKERIKNDFKSNMQTKIWYIKYEREVFCFKRCRICRRVIIVEDNWNLRVASAGEASCCLFAALCHLPLPCVYLLNA